MGETAAKALAIDPDLVMARVMYQSGNLDTWSHLAEIKALERAARQQPSNPRPLGTLVFNLIEAGYLQEAVAVAERLVDLEPLSLRANGRLFETLYAVGRTSEAVEALGVAEHLGSNFANWDFGIVNLVDKQDEIAIAHFEAYLQQHDYPDSTWVRELVTGARDPVTGQAYLDRRIPQIVASMPEKNAYEMQELLTRWYLFFGFLDRYFELILATELTDTTWTDAQNLFYDGTIFRRLGFTAHPMYLEVATALGIVDVWEQRGPPDFFSKDSGHWVCE